MRLVIVESPNKTRKIREILGPGHVVAASFGHVRDLPLTGGLGVTIAEGRVVPAYVPLEKAGRAIAELTRLAERADDILLATDPDREGEAIAWHIAEILGRPCRRVTFQAITDAAVRAAVRAPRAIDQHLVDAQQARRVLDRVVGWFVSPTLRGLGREARSAGRVQSVALRIVAEREAEIRAFTKADFHTLLAKLRPADAKGTFTAELVTWKGAPLGHRLAEAAIAERTVAWCRKQTWTVLRCERKEHIKAPPPPFTTATVQQAASVTLKLAPEQTMKLLQDLFEEGHITYHRTDSVALAPEAVAAARARIARDHPPEYLPAQPIVHGQKSANAQEAHEAIRPTHPEVEPHLGGDRAALYQLVLQRFLACQMAPGRDAMTTLDVACAPGTWDNGPMGVFQAKGVQVLFDGWRACTRDATEEAVKKSRDETPVAVRLPKVDRGDPLVLEDLSAKARSTKPPPRYTQASLIKRLESLGVGRPSTYAATLATLFARTYLSEEKRLLHATDLGLEVTRFLKQHYAGDFIDPDYTARMEGALDAVARGERSWEALVTQAAQALLVRAKAAGLRGDPLA